MIKVTCSNCGKQIFRKPCEIRNNETNRFFCSRNKCFGIFYSKIQIGKNHPKWNSVKVKCDYCGKSFYKSQSRLKHKNNFCSQSHHFLWFKKNAPIGVNCPSYRNGKTKLYNMIRTSPTYTLWRTSVYYRDKFTCQKCKKHCEKFDIIAHHLVSFKSLVEKHNIKTIRQALLCPKLWNIDDAITLCRSCHYKIHLELSSKKSDC